MIENKTTLEIVSNTQKAHYLLLVLPLITLIFYRANIYIILSYTIIFAIQSLYVHLMISFKKQIARDFTKEPKKEKIITRYLPYPKFLILTTTINLIALGYSFYLSGINYNPTNIYSQTLLWLHVFVVTFSFFILIFMQKLKKNIRNIRRKLEK